MTEHGTGRSRKQSGAPGPVFQRDRVSSVQLPSPRRD
jgi:hypothetical protein